MANVTESASWDAGVYQLETTDPVTGGPNGVDNAPHKNLANRTLWLKEQLLLLQTDVAGLDPDMQNMVGAAIKFAIDQAALANSGIESLHKISQQQGEFTLYNSRHRIRRGCIQKRN